MPVPNTVRRKILKTVGLAGAAGLAGCSTQSSQGDDGTTSTGGNQTQTGGNQTQTGTGDRPGEVSGTFTRGSTSEARTLNPIKIGDEATQNRLYLLFEGGHDVNENKEFEPLWFEEFNLGDDYKTLELKLRDDLQYSEPYGQMTTEDWMYNIEHIYQVGPDSNWTGFSYTSDFFQTVDGEQRPIDITADSDLKLTVNLHNSRPGYLFSNPFASTLIPFPKELLEEYVPKQDADSDAQTAAWDEFKKVDEVRHGTFNGNLGPFQFESWQESSQMVLARNDDYYRRGDSDLLENAPYFEEYKFQMFQENSTARNALKTGSVDWIGVDPLKYSSVKSASGVDIWESKYGDGIFFVSINQRANGWTPFRETEVRQALAHTLQPDKVVSEIQNGHATPAHTFHPSWGPYYSEDAVTTFNGGVEKARELMGSALSDTDYSYDGDTIVGTDGNPVELTLIQRAGLQSAELQANYVKQQFEKIGLNVSINAVQWRAILQKYLPNSGEGSWDTGGGTFNTGPRDTNTSPNQWDLISGVGFGAIVYNPWLADGYFTKQGGFNFSGYYPSEDLGSMFSEAATASSRDRVKEIMTEVFAILSKDQPHLWLFNDNLLNGYNTDLQNVPDVENYFTEWNWETVSFK